MKTIERAKKRADFRKKRRKLIKDRKRGNGIKAAALVLVMGLGGCAGWQPYTQVGIGYTIYQNTEAEFLSRCKYPFTIDLGVESESSSIVLRHDSHIDCGNPVGKNFDFSTNKILFSKKFSLSR